METTKAKILEAAKKNPCAKKVLEELFPGAFKSPFFKFGTKHTVSNSAVGQGPLFIGDGLAPEGLEQRCLILHCDYTMKVEKNLGYTILSFTKKRSKEV